MKTTFKRATALLLSLLMVFSVCSTSLVVYAQSGSDTSSNTINYASLGDSMSNGYGLPGYELNSGVETYGEVAYGNQFADWLVEAGYASSVDHAQLSMSGIRAEDIHWLLELDYEDESAIELIRELIYGEWDEAKWNAKFSTGDYWTLEEICDHSRLDATYTYAIPNGTATHRADKVAEIAKYYQESVANADIISLGIGNGNLGVFAFGRIMEAIGFGGEPSEAMIYNVESAIRECDPETQAQLLTLKEDLYSAVEGKLGQPISDNPTLEALANTVVYTGLSYVLNYAGSVEAILQLNPDAEIILVALMNTYQSDAVVEGITIGDVLEVVCTPLNAYIAALPTVMQGAQNSIYANAKFYYAEAPEVDCLVSEFGSDFWDENGTAIKVGELESLTRDRFVESIVGTADEPGMVWKMLSLDGYYPTLEEIVAFERSTTENKVANYGPSTINDYEKSKAYVINLYLGFEKAILNAIEAPVVIESVLNLNNEILGGIVSTIAENLKTAVDESLAISFDNHANRAINATVYMLNNDAINATVVKGVLRQKEGYTEIPSFGYDEAYGAYTAGYGFMYTPDIIAETLKSDANLFGLCALFARCIVGNGLGAHPSAAGHNALFEAVKNAYTNDYTAADKTFENIYYVITTYYDDAYAYAYDYAEQSGYIAAATGAIDQAYDAVADVVIPFPDGTTEAFLVQAFALRKEALDTLAAAKALILAADVLDQESLDALLALLGEAAEDLAAIDALLAQAAVDANTLAIIPALKAAHNELVNVVIPAVDSMLQQAVIEGTKKFVELAKTALGDLADAAVKAAIKFAPELDAMLYDYFYNNPEEVIAFFAEYGYIIADLCEKYGEEALGVAAYVLVVYGEDMAVYFMENYETIFEGIVAWADKYGERTIEMIQVYAEATGLCDAVREEIAALEEKLAELEAQLDYQLKVLEEQLGVQLEALKAELEALKTELLIAAEPYKQAILAEIAKVEALIAEVEAKIEQVKALIAEIEAKIVEIQNQLLELNARLENLVNAIKNLDEALKYLAYAGVEAATGMIQSALNSVAYAVSQLVGFVSEEAAKALDALIEEAKAFLDEAFYNATHADYAIDNTSSYVALGDNTMTAQLFGQYVASIVDAEDVYYTYKTTDLTVAGSKISGLPAILAENLATVAAADLISIGYGYEALAEETMTLLFDLILLGTADVDYNIDLVAKVGPEAAAEIEKIVADVYATLIENNLGITLTSDGFTVADAVVIAAKYFAYYAAEYAVYMPQVVNAIHEINPEALIMVNAISNPLAGAAIAVSIPEMGLDLEVAFGDYLNYITDVIFVESAVIAAINEKVVFVPATGIETTYTNKTLAFEGYQSFISFLMNYKDAKTELFNVETTVNGNVAVINKMADALNITVEHSALLGDVNGDGVVSITDAVLVLRFDAQLPDVSLDLSVADVDGDGMVNITDAVWILRYDAQLVEKFPASK